MCSRARPVTGLEKGAGEKVDVIQWLRVPEGLDGCLGLSVDDDMRGVVLQRVTKSAADDHEFGPKAAGTIGEVPLSRDFPTHESDSRCSSGRID